MYENIEKVIRHCYGVIHIEEERYGDGLIGGIDSLNCTDIEVYKGSEIKDAIDQAASPGDIDAMDAFFRLEEYSDLHPEFLYVRGQTFEEILKKLDQKAALWNAITFEEQKQILQGFVRFQTNNL